jgi:hypothetical protein
MWVQNCLLPVFPLKEVLNDVLLSFVRGVEFGDTQKDYSNCASDMREYYGCFQLGEI